MDARKVRYRLNHILEAIAAIESYVTGMDFKAYQADPLVHDAVERNLERLSEAARYIPDELKAEHPKSSLATSHRARQRLAPRL